MSEEDKKKLKEDQKNYREAKKKCFTNANVSVKMDYKIFFFLVLLLIFNG